MALKTKTEEENASSATIGIHSEKAAKNLKLWEKKKRKNEREKEKIDSSNTVDFTNITNGHYQWLAEVNKILNLYARLEKNRWW